MADQDYASFDSEIVQQSLAAAKQHNDSERAGFTADTMELADGALKVGAHCITVTVKDGQVCLDIPFVGKKCLPVPAWVPEGSALEACLSLCTKFGLPCGAEVTVKLAGKLVFTKTFGCSC